MLSAGEEGEAKKGKNLATKCVFGRVQVDRGGGEGRMEESKLLSKKIFFGGEVSTWAGQTPVRQ